MRHIEHCMGTVFSLELRDAIAPADLTGALAWLHEVDATFSTYRADSEVSRLGRGELRLAECTADVRAILALCADLRERTNGYFDAYASGTLDPSGAVKGWAIERLHQRLLAAGSTRHTVNGGGDIRCCGGRSVTEPWRFGIAHPLLPGELVDIVSGTDFALATSGVAERGAHILDPHTGRPPHALASMSLIGADMATVDAYATAAFAMGDAARDWLADQSGFEALAVTSDGRTWSTPGWPGR